MARTTMHRYLVTVSDDRRMILWAGTAVYANWLEGRAGQNGETWAVTVFDEDADHFLNAARNVGATVEEIEYADQAEEYVLIVGTPGTGWQP